MSQLPLRSASANPQAEKSYYYSFRFEHLSDKIGVAASSLCAVHCLITPVLLIFAKDFAGIWAHPAAHWILAAVTIPLALHVIMKSGKQHGRKWVIYCALLGSLAIIASLIAPMLVEPATAGDAVRCTKKGCCPTVVSGADGSFSLDFPLASIFSIIGGVLLIASHLGNLFYNRCHFDGRHKCGC